MIKDRIPTLSVLLPVYNAGRFLAEALESLAAQTFPDFEVIAVNDGSTDGSAEILRAAALRRPWLRVVDQPNGGVAAALNRAFAESRGALLARMDADDIALPRRFERQVAFLDRHPEVGVCGTAIREFGPGTPRVLAYPRFNSGIRARLVFGSALAHPTVVMRRPVLQAEAGPYSGQFEDYDLWLRLAGRTEFANLPEVLLEYRIHAGQVTAAHWALQNVHVWRTQSVFLRTLGFGELELSPEAHAFCGMVEPEGLIAELPRVEAWLLKLRRAVPAAGWCRPCEFVPECRDAWWRAVRRSLDVRGRTVVFFRSPLCGFNPRSLWRAARLLMRNRPRP